MSMATSLDPQAQADGKPEGPPTVAVSRAVAAPVTHVWEVLVSPAGAQALLGEGAVLGAKGEAYHCADGTYGVVRSYHPLEQLRVSWHAGPDGPASVVEVDLRADGDGTVLDLSQTHLHDGLDPAELAARWAGSLAALAEAAQT